MTQLAELVRSKQVRSVELTEMYLSRMKRHNPKLLCAVTITEELAMKQARAADQEIAAGKYRGPLHGIPYGVKDLCSVKGYPTTWGAAPFRDRVFDFDATAIVKGLRAISDFEYELEMNQLNRHLAADVESVYLMASPQFSFVSSSGVREIAAFGGDVSALVPEPVARRLAELFPDGRPGTPERPGE